MRLWAPVPVRRFLAAEDGVYYKYILLFLAKRTQQGLTLIEISVTIGILAVISTLTVLVINPIELFKESRDAQRASDLAQILNAIEFANLARLPIGTVTNVYVSIPQDGTGNCPTISPTLQAGFTYVCAPLATYRNTDGTGWLPINFNLAMAGTKQKSNLLIATAQAASAPFVRLPIDPENSSTAFYAYTMNSRKYEVITRFESLKYFSKMQNDEGSDPDFYEVGPGASLWGQAGGSTALVGYWPFNEGSGLTALDVSGQGNNAALTGGATWVGGHLGQGLSFNGTSNFLFINPSASLPNLGAFTYSAWVYPTGDDTMRYIFWYGNTGAVPYASLAISTEGGQPNALIFQRSTSACYVSVRSIGNALTQNTWQHVAVTWSGVVDFDSMELYRDGVRVSQSGAQNGCGGTASNLSSHGIFVGSRTSSGSFFSGMLDEVRMYNRAFSASEVNQLYLSTR